MSSDHTSEYHQMASPGSGAVPSPSPVPLGGGGLAVSNHTPRTSAQQQLLSQQAQSLLEEAKNENRILEENVATLREQVWTNLQWFGQKTPWCCFIFELRPGSESL